MTNKNLDKIGKILSDTGNSKLKEFDIVYLIDATSSMGPFIEAAKSTADNISKILRQKFPETNFQYGYVFYRDPIDSPSDIHEIIDLTDDVNSLPEKIGKILPIGGGDIPEDWVGAYRKVNEEIIWRNDSTKVIFHLADAGAHGKLFTPYDKYEDEEEKLIKELDLIFEKKTKIFGFVIEEDSRNSFEKCKNLYRNKGGFYEIYNFEKPQKNNDYENFCGIKLFPPYSGSADPPKPFIENKKRVCLFGNKESTSMDKTDRVFYNPYLNHTTGCLFGNNNSTNNDKPKTKSLFATIEKENSNEKESLFGNNEISSNDNPKTGSLFGNISEKNNNKDGLFENKSNNGNSLFGNINQNNNNKGNLLTNNNTNGLFGYKEENNSKGSLFGNNSNITSNLFCNNGNIFGNNNNVNNLFGNKVEKNDKGSLFGNINNNKSNGEINSLFGNINTTNNNSFNLFRNKTESNIFGNYIVDNINKNSEDLEENKNGNNNYYNSFQSNLNNSFMNFVVDSIQKVNSSNNNNNNHNLFNNN